MRRPVLIIFIAVLLISFISTNFNTEGPIIIPAIKNKTISGKFNNSLNLLQIIPVSATTANIIKRELHCVVKIEDSIYISLILIKISNINYYIKNL